METGLQSVSITTGPQFLNAIADYCTPDAGDRHTASVHRTNVEDWLTDDLGAYRMFETGSWSHGTAVKDLSDVDYFAVMRGPRPTDSRASLISLRRSLARRFDATVLVSAPAVYVNFNDDAPSIEVVPAYYNFAGHGYWIPDPQGGSGWINSDPAKHLAYVDKARDRVIETKRFIRLIKTWRYFHRVPLSCFYLEMRAAKHVLDHDPFVLIWDLCWYFEGLDKHGCDNMNDPSDFTGGRIVAAPDHDKAAARAAVHTAALASRRALEAHMDKRHPVAVQETARLFGLPA